MARIFERAGYFGRDGDDVGDRHATFRTRRPDRLTSREWIGYHRRLGYEHFTRRAAWISFRFEHCCSRDLAERQRYFLLGRGIPPMLDTGRGDWQGVQTGELVEVAQLPGN